ncbi:mechanosensitive ion channel family protein [Ectobacillus sp. JY-23]|uniref:mechanosensitive ion channel family protein n=1 Tax=Ectobacillus sp. JY-23 TaxID=2933872 RepID=UPI001FF52BD6|nr:mechanosensitive ion channel domain-containing protein [Ectobacillus sp. JY-23]UOY93970.1 mechanosensitive ion channel family protein [Ectobacillus sp. JY-23]
MLETILSLDWSKAKSYIFSVLLAFFISYFGFALVRYFLHQLFQRTNLIEEKKEQTIETVVKNTSRYATLIIVLLVAIKPFIDLKQLLVAGGVIGIIIGFGAQSAIKDFLYGFFFLFEGQLKKGDFVTINNEQAGSVEDLGFRVVSVRLMDGKLMTVSNGEVRKVVNGNVHHRRIFESVVVGFQEDPTRIRILLEETCELLNELHDDYLLRHPHGEIVEPYQYWGMSSLDACPYGFRFSIAATVHDVHYLKAAQETKFLLAKKIHEEGIILPTVQAVYTRSLQG